MSSDKVQLYRSARPVSRVRIVLGLRRIVLSAIFCAPFAVSPALVQAAPLSPSDPCLSFLSTGFTSGSAADESRTIAGADPAAGTKAATLSLLLGVRLALGPTEDLNGAKKNAAHDAGMSALDIQRYRTCKKEQALRVSYAVN